MSKKKELVKELNSLIRRYKKLLKLMRSGQEIDLQELGMLNERKESIMATIRKEGVASE